VVYKGTHPEIDSYSTFFDNARRQQTDLHRYLQDAGITDIYLCGLATDYCVLYSSLDALELGYSVIVIENACRGVNVAQDDSAKAMQQIVASGGRVIASTMIHGQGKEGMR
jgi:nicotinamidase/pyrazinamidase